MSGFVIFGEAQALATEGQLEVVEGRLGRPLPVGLRRMLAERTNGDEVMPNQVDQDGNIGVSNFLGTDLDSLDSIVARSLELRDVLPDWFIPFADCAGGNLLGVNAAGEVFFWDHEFDGGIAVSKIADSIENMEAMVKSLDIPETRGVVIQDDTGWEV